MVRLKETNVGGEKQKKGEIRVNGLLVKTCVMGGYRKKFVRRKSFRRAKGGKKTSGGVGESRPAKVRRQMGRDFREEK